MQPVSIVGDEFVQGGKPLRILSGAIHYFRVIPEYWRDRLEKLRACGFNTLETYVAWNMHEPRPGEFVFDGRCDLASYVEIAGDLGLNVILRPGPYICSEWDCGGLPAWLLADGNMRLRCAYQPYLDAVDRFMDALMERLVPLQASKGGPIIAMQIENEYGSHGNDKVYLRHLGDGLRARGFEGLLFTSDGAGDWMLAGGTLPDVHKVANFGSGAVGQFAKLREWQPAGPLMCGEFWAGWFEHWGEERHARTAEDAARELDVLLGTGGSVNVYMFHGGTNFGFMNGANHPGTYQPTVTSYDFGAALSEAGDPTDMYLAFRDVVAKYGAEVGEVPASSEKAAYGEVEMTGRVGLFDSLDALSKPIERPTPDPMETVGQNYGFILYRTKFIGPREPMPLVLMDVHDRALVFVDGQYRGVIDRDGPKEEIVLEFAAGEHQLDLLVENMGRVNYGPHLADRKGITEGVRLGYAYGQFLFGWTLWPMGMDDLSGLVFGELKGRDGPAFYRGVLKIDEAKDTFLALPGWTKGVVWMNGFNLGRYWDRGPQKTLYVPAPVLKEGENEIVVFELHGAGKGVEFRDVPELG